MFSLTLYRDGKSVNPALTAAPAHRQGLKQPMKTTMMFRNIANPRRTTLAHLSDADELQMPEQPEHAIDLPMQTANPRRTVLMDAPAQ